jgi:two-component system NarL family sensor kinase
VEPVVDQGERVEDELRVENQRLRSELDELRAELTVNRQLVAQVMEAEDQGRRRIAQLIHDDSLQTLLAANQELIEAAPGRAQVQRAHEVVEAAIKRLREAVEALHPVTLEQGGLEQALGAVARQAGRQGGFTTEIEIDRAALDLHDEVLLAVARELLTNTARHAGASVVTVKLQRSSYALELEIADDGHGFQPGRLEAALAQGHIGLASVGQRVRSACGTFEVESSSKGTIARTRLPLEPPPE